MGYPSDRTLTSLTPCPSPSRLSWGATKARPDQARHSATLGPTAGVQGPHPGSTGAPRGRRHGSLSPRHSAVTATLGPSAGVHGPHPGSAGALAGPTRHIARPFPGDTCRFGLECGNSHLIGSCESLPAGAPALPGGLGAGHLVLAPTPSPPTWASVQSRADRELRAGMPVEQCLSVLG